MGAKRSTSEALQFLVLLSASLALVPAYVDGLIESEHRLVSNYEPPRMKPAINETIIALGGNLTLECEGKHPITWDLPVNQSDDMQEALSNISTSEDYNAEYPYRLRLELFNLSVIDVGFYTCLFNTSDNNDYTIPDLVVKGQAKSIYVYVDDPARLMVPVHMIVTGTQYSSVTVACRPTAPDVRVTLHRDGAEIALNKRLEVMNDRVVTYDRRYGYTIPEVEMGDSSHSWECMFFRDGFNESQNFALSIMPHTVSVPRPQINDSFNGNTVLGGELHLDCFVRIDPGIPFHVIWTYPNKYIDLARVNISNATTGNINSDFPQKIGKSSITIYNITAEDSGIYRCDIYDANKNTNSAQKYIKVLEKGYSYINLSEGAGIYTITADSGSLANWVILVDAYPIPTITWFDNHNNEIAPTWSIAHSSKHEVKSSHKDTNIRINRLTLADGGIYRLRAKNAYETKDLNLALVVKEKPTVELGSKKFFMRGTIASIGCHVTGFPLPVVNWAFLPCLKNCEGVPREEKKGELKIDAEYSETSIVKIPVNRSGYLTCNAKNEKGTDQSTSVFFVSDIEDGFGIIGNDKGNPIAVGDDVTLACAASIYTNFTGTNWYKLPENIIINDKNFNGVSITRKRTDFSYQVIMSIPNITKSHISKYACRADTTQEDGTVEQEMDLLVQDTISPIITTSNMNGSEIQQALGEQNFFFYCRATGIPIPEIKWYKDDVMLQLDDVNPNDKSVRVKLTENGKRLEFTHIKEEDQGKYTCRASSRVGYASRTMTIALQNGDFKSGYIATIIVLAIVFILLITYLIFKIRKEKQIRKQLFIDGLLHFEEGATECLNPELGVDEQAELLPYDKKWEFPRDMLKLGKQLGSGAFGVVMKAVAQNIVEGEESTVVAVKQVKKTADPTFVKTLASELKIMVHLGKHLNVVNLLGACTKNVTKHELLVIVEYCRFGNLHNYLLRHRGNFIDQVVHSTDFIDPTIGIEMINRAYSISSNKSGGNKYAALPLLRSGSNGDSGLNSGGLHSPGLDTNNTVISMIPNGDTDGIVVSSGSVQPEWRSNYRGDYNYNRDVRPISTQDLLCWSFQVARGMEYLANRKVLHGDLAARNILLADDNIVKICDFGLAKSMYKNDNYKKKGDGLLPVKWMAIESIRDRVFSTQSDVWSYGIVLWELFSLASTPYPGMEADEKLYNRIIEGYRMEKPQYANKQIYETMLECWRGIPIHRPSFTQLAERLGYLLEDSVRKHYIDLNDPYMDMNSRWIAERGDSDYLAMMNSPDYGNLVSATATHDYVNDPFGGPTSVNPLSPDNTDAEGYLCMSPANNGVVTKDAPVFNFNIATPKRMQDLLDEDKNKPVELIPMLNVNNEAQRPGSDSDLGESNPTSPRSLHSPILPDVTSFTNPSYQPMYKIPTTNGNVPIDDLIVSKDNYVNMSKKDSGFCDSMDPKLSPSAFTNPSYVTMNAKNKVPHIYNNVPSSTVV